MAAIPFPFVFTLISPLCLDYICKIQCYLETRHRGPIITVEKNKIYRHFGLNKVY